MPGEAFAASLGQRAGIKERLHEGAAVDMHLLIGAAIERDVEHAGREGARNGRRGEQDATHRVERLGVSAGGDGADVPDHGLLGVEIGGADQQQAPVAVAGGDVAQHLVVKHVGDRLEQRRVVGERIVEQRRGDAARD